MSASNATLRIGGLYHIPVYLSSLDPEKSKWICWGTINPPNVTKYYM